MTDTARSSALPQPTLSGPSASSWPVLIGGNLKTLQTRTMMENQCKIYKNLAIFNTEMKRCKHLRQWNANVKTSELDNSV